MRRARFNLTLSATEKLALAQVAVDLGASSLAEAVRMLIERHHCRLKEEVDNVGMSGMRKEVPFVPRG